MRIPLLEGCFEQTFNDDKPIMPHPIGWSHPLACRVVSRGCAAGRRGGADGRVKEGADGDQSATGGRDVAEGAVADVYLGNGTGEYTYDNRPARPRGQQRHQVRQREGQAARQQQ